MGQPQADWRKSSYSSTGANCVEVATSLPIAGAIRDRKNSDAGAHVVGHPTWRAFVAAIRHGQFTR